jgi:hypothetical protein
MNGVQFAINLKDNFDQTLEKMDKRFNKTFDNMKKRSKELSENFSGLGTTLLGVGVVAFSKKIIDATANVEKMQIRLNQAFKADFGSGFGSELYKDIVKVQESSEISRDSFVDFAIKMKEVQNRGGDLSDTLRRLSDISQGNEGSFSTLGDSLTKLSKGFSFTEKDLKSFTLMGFDPLIEISRETGESMTSLHNRLKEGKIGFDDIQIAIKKATSEGGDFANLSNQIAEIFGNRLNSQIARFPDILAKMGKPLTDKLEPLLGWIEKFTDKIMNGSIDLTRFTNVMSNLTLITLGSVAAIKAFNFVVSMNPVTRMVTSVALLGSYLYEVVNWSTRFSEIWKNFGSGKIFDGIASFGKLIREMITKPILALFDALTSIIPGEFAKKINDRVKVAIASNDKYFSPKIDATEKIDATQKVEPIKRKTTTELIRDMEQNQDAENKTNRLNSGGIQTFNLSIQNLIGMSVGTLEGKDIDASRVAEILKAELLKQTAQLKGF